MVALSDVGESNATRVIRQSKGDLPRIQEKGNRRWYGGPRGSCCAAAKTLNRQPGMDGAQLQPPLFARQRKPQDHTERVSRGDGQHPPAWESARCWHGRGPIRSSSHSRAGTSLAWTLRGSG